MANVDHVTFAYVRRYVKARLSNQGGLFLLFILIRTAYQSQKAMLDFALKVCRDSGRVDEADFQALHTHGFSDEDIWDIAAITAFFGLSNRMANLISMRPNDEFYPMGRVPKA